MDLSTVNDSNNCPRAEIAAYLDGELSPREEIVLEKHLAVCQKCLTELNSQKQLLLALDFAFEEKIVEVELPKDFTKVVVANAENRVQGLRSKKERFWSLSLCSTFFLFAFVGFGAESGQVLHTISNFGGRVLALSGFIFHFISDAAIGFAVVLRYLSQKVVFSSGFIALSLFCLLALVFFFYLRFILKPNR